MQSTDITYKLKHTYDLLSSSNNLYGNRICMHFPSGTRGINYAILKDRERYKLFFFHCNKFIRH